ncbi:translation initiation factor IF-2 [Alkalibacter saccharofermentans]|uniref:Translation initiation factor IF-2 n=1 Tax=Alkalibacter saccharofermentans DSM 14828 TaxID=1120975 RepID=A0A1M4S731_9FIRM|nr:translation initiation factor IF-2 [Alkalibacter saccharofermentans]SHE27837.1 translation initiation factor IF-2 [Alkalibacter saccharofermentans DSM 14828]
MNKVRVYDLAKELNVNSKELVKVLNSMDIPVKNHMSALTEQQEKYFRNNYNKSQGESPKQEKTPVKTVEKKEQAPQRPEAVKEKATEGAKPLAKPQAKTEQKADKKKLGKKDFRKSKKPPVTPVAIDNSKKEKKSKSAYKKKKGEDETEELVAMIPTAVSVGDFAVKINVPSTEIIKKLIGLGVMASINQEIDFETAEVVASELGVKIELEDVEEEVAEMLNVEEEEDEENLIHRPPVITVMGHVDHGKTSLLDAIRKTSVTAKEAGGITQHIGAYMVKTNDEAITFIDTPGHEAFTAMRHRGASITDIAVLVVAADDGVMPQTVEALNHARAAKVPIIVAINKIDKPGANPDKVKQELTEYNLVAEEWGGDTIFVPVSAMTREGLDTLLEMILLVAEVQELKANPDRLSKGTVIDAKLDKGRGVVATLLVNAGTLRVGDSVVSGTSYGKIRAMLNDKGKKVKTAGPSTPVEILGLNEVPEAGEEFYAVKDDRTARQIADKRRTHLKEQKVKRSAPLSLDELYNHIKQGEVQDINIIIKGDVQGSVEALKQSLEKLTNEEVRVNIIHGGVGAVTESDVMLAAASNGIIIGFNVRPGNNVNALAEREEVDLRLYRVIYDAIADVEQAMKGMLAPEYKEVVLGTAEVRQTFKVPNIGTIAGCYVTNGKIARSNDVRVIRDGIVVFEGKMTSLKRFKDDAKEVAQGYECGIGVEKYNDLKEGDQIEAFTMEEIART